jgi:hypothetical protein
LKSIQHAKTETWKEAFVTDLKDYYSTLLETPRYILKSLAEEPAERRESNAPHIK